MLKENGDATGVIFRNLLVGLQWLIGVYARKAWKHGSHISQKNERNELNFDGCLVTSWGSGPQMSISLPVYILSAPIRARARASSHPYLRSADLAQSITVII